MKKSLKIFLVILLLLVLGLEVYFYFFKTNSKSKTDYSLDNIESKKGEKVETKYLANLYTGYKSDNLTFNDVKESDQIYYKTISGLKDKTIEEKVNSKIKEKIDKLKTGLNSDNYITTSTLSNFENTLSIAFCLEKKASYYEPSYDQCFQGVNEGNVYSSISDALNIDLTTGNEINIKDIVNVKSSIKASLIKQSYEDLSKIKGIVCHGGPCENPEPNYSTVEDEILSIVQKYNKDDYIFTFTPNTLTLTFNNLNINMPKYCGDYGHKSSNCKNYEYISIDQTAKSDVFVVSIPLLNILDNLTIYDKFKTSDNIYEKESTNVDRKFIIINDFAVTDAHMIETDNSLIDYDLGFSGIGMDSNLEKIIKEKAKNSVVKESSSLKTDKFNIYDMFGYISELAAYKYYYVYYDVKHYKLDKDIFEKKKKQIYIDKYSKASSNEGDVEYATYDDNKYGYSYLKDYLDKDGFYYYIYDENGNEVSTKNIVNHDYLSSVIPDEWLNLGKYKTKEDMINNALSIKGINRDYPNNLVIYYDYNNYKIKLKYKGKEIYLSGNYEDYKKVENQLYK